MKTFIFIVLWAVTVTAHNIQDDGLRSLFEDDNYGESYDESYADDINDDNGDDDSYDDGYDDDSYDDDTYDDDRVYVRRPFRIRERCRVADYDYCDKFNVVRENCTTNRNIRRILCPNFCGTCDRFHVPFEATCSSENVYGCCFNGDPAVSMKRNCPNCRDKNKRICKSEAKPKCRFSSTREKFIAFCPVLCGACHRFGNVCEDKDVARCSLLPRDKASCCENSALLQVMCPKTCGLCVVVQ